ncbi:MAG: 50S ribosomal protein L24 [Gammaproteobacteria bacterium]|nr:50S ribosomal protein L24 [Gammaproteobacteria bacterium]
MNRINKGDDVIVIAGKDKGKQGSVLRVMQDGHLLVSDINMAKRHTKPNPNRGVPGGIVEKEMPLDPSNVMLFNPQTGKGDRVGFKILEDGRKVRFFKSTDEVVDI